MPRHPIQTLPARPSDPGGGNSGVRRAPRDTDGGALARSLEQDGRFRRLARLGRGAMGVVHEVYDRERDLRLALKELRQVTPTSLLRFKDEFRALRDLRHPNLVALDDLIEHDGRWYFTMEVVDGVDFLAYVRPGEQQRSGTSSRSAPASSATAQQDGPPSSESGPPGTVADAEVADAATLAEPELETAATVVTDPLITGEVLVPAGVEEVAAAAPAFDERRLRSALRQIAAGVAALHRAGKVHRDLKPSNILVEQSGRVVILDFGVVADLASAHTEPQRLVGTVAYMAPEQTLGEPVSEATDWYAVGVLMFRAMTGRMPFTGTTEQILAHKRTTCAPLPQTFTRDLPHDLANLCARLLERAPAARPDASEVLDVLGANEDEGWYASVTLGAGRGAPFVGRATELAHLDDALLDTRAGTPCTVVVEGASGVGKSATIAEFLSTARARHQPLLALRGRCHEREAVPYKAFDGIVDELARHLAQRSTRHRPRLPEDHVAALVQLFPALGLALPAPGAQAPGPHDATRTRTRAFEALRQLLDALAREGPVVLAIDDIQWADADSLALLEELTGASPAPAVLLLLGARQGPEAAAALAHVRGPLSRVALGGLPATDARALIERLVARTTARLRGGIDRIIEETGGHPMFIDELVRQHALGDPRDTGRVIDLDSALRARVARHDETAQLLVHLVCVAGSPVAHAAVARAAQIGAQDYRRAIDQLRAQLLVRIRGARQLDTVEPYHDRVREAVYDALPAPRRIELHRALAAAIEDTGGPADMLAHHYERAGDAPRAAHHAELAAEAAAASLAFERAADLYRLALELGEHDVAHRAALGEALGRALQHAGRGREAAEAYAAAAALTSGQACQDLQRRSAEQLLMGGHVHAGKQASSRVLATIGMRLPPPSMSTMLKLFYMLLRVRLSPLRWTARREADCPPELVHRVDTCWSVSAGLSMVDTTVGMYFSVLGLRQSLPLGEPFRIARAACTVSVVASALEQAALATRTHDLAADAARVDDTTVAQCYAAIASMVRSFLVEQQWAESEAHCRTALDLWRTAGMGRGFESDFITQFQTWALAMQGQIEAARREVDEHLREARAAGNRFLEVSLRVFHHLPHQASDRPDEGRRDVRDAIDSWLDEDAFALPHCWTQISLRSLAIYEGRFELDAAEQSGWRQMRRSVLWHVGYVRNQAEHLEARWDLARAVAIAGREPSVARDLRRRAARRGRRLMRRKTPVTRLWGEMALAGAHAAEGDDERAVAILEPLVGALEEAGCELDATCARRRLGQTLGGERGALLVAATDTWFRDQNVRDPARLTAALMPGWREN